MSPFTPSTDIDKTRGTYLKRPPAAYLHNYIPSTLPSPTAIISSTQRTCSSPSALPARRTASQQHRNEKENRNGPQIETKGQQRCHSAKPAPLSLRRRVVSFNDLPSIIENSPGPPEPKPHQKTSSKTTARTNPNSLCVPPNTYMLHQVPSLLNSGPKSSPSSLKRNTYPLRLRIPSTPQKKGNTLRLRLPATASTSGAIEGQGWEMETYRYPKTSIGYPRFEMEGMKDEDVKRDMSMFVMGEVSGFEDEHGVGNENEKPMTKTPPRIPILTPTRIFSSPPDHKLGRTSSEIAIHGSDSSSHEENHSQPQMQTQNEDGAPPSSPPLSALLSEKEFQTLVRRVRRDARKVKVQILSVRSRTRNERDLKRAGIIAGSGSGTHTTLGLDEQRGTNTKVSPAKANVKANMRAKRKVEMSMVEKQKDKDKLKSNKRIMGAARVLAVTHTAANTRTHPRTQTQDQAPAIGLGLGPSPAVEENLHVYSEMKKRDSKFDNEDIEVKKEKGKQIAKEHDNEMENITSPTSPFPTPSLNSSLSSLPSVPAISTPPSPYPDSSSGSIASGSHSPSDVDVDRRPDSESLFPAVVRGEAESLSAFSSTTTTASESERRMRAAEGSVRVRVLERELTHGPSSSRSQGQSQSENPSHQESLVYPACPVSPAALDMYSPVDSQKLRRGHQRQSRRSNADLGSLHINFGSEVPSLSLGAGLDDGDGNVDGNLGNGNGNAGKGRGGMGNGKRKDRRRGGCCSFWC